jgi:hypothetical protein
MLPDKSTGKKPLGRPRSRWKNNIRMDLIEILVNIKNWIDPPQDRGYLKALVSASSNLGDS